MPYKITHHTLQTCLPSDICEPLLMGWTSTDRQSWEITKILFGVKTGIHHKESEGIPFWWYWLNWEGSSLSKDLHYSPPIRPPSPQPCCALSLVSRVGPIYVSIQIRFELYPFYLWKLNILCLGALYRRWGTRVVRIDSLLGKPWENGFRI